MSAIGGSSGHHVDIPRVAGLHCSERNEDRARVTVADERLGWPKKLNVSFW